MTLPEPQVCRSCRSPIRWGTDANTRRLMPVEAEPSPTGNISVYVDSTGDLHLVVLNRSKSAAMRAAGHPLFLSHFVSCPHAARWRKDHH
ncbi:hypothetical protein [Gordonia sp. (in: high G+C Gram-positive bacteria)]|uniref:hypothetical protein n=1 Tax=Gordonia sp. (in: high G+C Gram-positive bacteria) TaxID=84139 RepID=UPI003C766E01